MTHHKTHIRKRTLILVSLLAFLYNDWILGPLLNSKVSTRSTLISELSAQTQPYHWVFRTLDISAGILTLLLLPLLAKLLLQMRVRHRWLLLSIVGLIGADSIIDACLPMSCAPSIDANCSLITAASQSILTRAHLIESTIIGIITFVGPIIWWLASHKKHHALARISWQFLAIQVVVGAGILLGEAFGYNLTGIMQRLYELSIGGWITILMYVSLEHSKRFMGGRLSMPAIEPNLIPVEGKAVST